MKHIIDKYSRLPFRYGADCCQFVGECVESLTGNNPMQAFEYSTEDQANAILALYGDLVGAITATLGEPYPGYKNDDVCVFENNGRQVAGIIYQNRIVTRTPSGVMDYPPDWATHFWAL